MELKDLLIELSNADDNFTPRNGLVSKEVIDSKLKANNYDIDVKAPKGTKFEYNGGEGKVPLKCKKGQDHDLVSNGKLSFNSLKKRFMDKGKKAICKTCADKEGKTTAGTSRSEIDFKNALVDFITNELGCNVTVYFGSNKAKTEYLSKSGKRELDYDIKINDNNDGSKTFAISIQGPPHTPYNQNANDNDSIRATEEAKRGGNYVVTPAFLKDEKLFNDKLNDIKLFIRGLYNKITLPVQSKKTKKLAKRFGADSPEVAYRVNERNKVLNDRIESIKNSPIQKQLNQIITALQDNIGLNRTTYKGKYDNIVDYMYKDKNRFGSFESHKDEWNELIKVGTKQEFNNWINKYQAVSDFDKKYLGTQKSKKLFEDKKDR